MHVEVGTVSRAGKNMGSGWYQSRQIGYSNENFISKLCANYKSNTLINSDPDSDVWCPDPVVGMSEIVIWFLNILTEILCDQIRNPNPIFQCSEPVIRSCFYKIFWRICTTITHKPSCPNPNVQLSEFVPPEMVLKIRTTEPKLECPNPNLAPI